MGGKAGGVHTVLRVSSIRGNLANAIKQEKAVKNMKCGKEVGFCCWGYFLVFVFYRAPPKNVSNLINNSVKHLTYKIKSIS